MACSGPSSRHVTEPGDASCDTLAGPWWARGGDLSLSAATEPLHWSLVASAHILCVAQHWLVPPPCLPLLSVRVPVYLSTEGRHSVGLIYATCV